MAGHERKLSTDTTRPPHPYQLQLEGFTRGKANGMTREQVLHRAEVMAAWAKGANAQWQRKNGIWEEVSEICGWNIELPIRIKPEPKLRPWKREEVPLDAWLKHKSGHTWFRILSIGNDYVLIAAPRQNGLQFLFSELLEQSEHSIDGGKTWLPAGVMEDAK